MVKKAFRRRPSPALVISLIALFVALGGTGYAALKLPSNSVGPGQIRTGAVGKPEIRRGAVGTQELATDAARGQDVLESSLGKVPSAARADDAGHAANADSVGGAPEPELTVGRSFHSSGCDPNVGALVCHVGFFKAPRRSRLLVIVTGEWFSNVAPSGARCGTQVHLVQEVAHAQVSFGETTDTTDATHPGNFSATGITDPVPAGDYEIDFYCTQTSGDIQLGPMSMSVAMLGAG